MPTTRPAGKPGAPVLRGPWHALRTTDFAHVDPQRTVAVLPVSATEQHGPHLPLATDAIINAGILGAAFDALPADASVLLLPALPVGDSLEHTAFAGTLSVPRETLLQLWLAMGRSVARAGVRKLVVFNSHGGQRAHVDQLAVQLRAELGLLVVRAHSFGLGMPPGLFDDTERAHGLHGGAIETSLLLHLRPELVDTAALADFPSWGAELAARGGLLGVEKPVGIGWMAQDLNPAGVCGDARAASADQGAALLAHAAQALAGLLLEVAALPLPAWALPGPGGTGR